MGLRQFCLGLLIVSLSLVPGGEGSIRFDTVGEVLSRSTGFPAFGSHTQMVWVYRSVNTAVDEVVHFIAPNQANVVFLGMYVFQSDNAFMLNTNLGEGEQNGPGPVTTTNTWYHVAWVFNDTANTYQLYVNGTLASGATLTVTGSTTWGYEILGDTVNLAGLMWNGRVADYKFFTTVLSATEIGSEMRYWTPVRSANLHTWSPLRRHTALEAYRGGTAWTATGTLSTEADPPGITHGESPGNAFLGF